MGQENQILQLVSPRTAPFKEPVRVSWKLDGRFLLVKFNVTIPVQYAKKVYDPGDYPYEFDVVEVFIHVNGSKEGNLPYYEFEVTPYNQTLEVKISDLAKPFELGITTGTETSAKETPQGWTGEFRIPLDKLGWNGNPKDVRGNFFGIFGNSPRTYWSLYLAPQEVAAFHKPDFFRPLF